MKKYLISLLLALSLLAALPAQAVSEETMLRTVQALGILTGDQYGDLALDREVTRAEFAKLLVAASQYKDIVTPEGAGYSLYKDVKSGYWASEYIRICAQEGWMIGYTDGTFGPYNTITLEEACTAALRPLGYDSSNLTGAFPYAQLNKADAVKLRENLARRMGEKMTRRDCAILFYNLLTAKTSSGQVYASTLGYAVKDGEVDYSSVILTDLKGPYVASAGEQLPFTPLTVYRDGEPSSNGVLSANEVYYYNTNVRTLWVYTKQVAGLITALTPSASEPTAVTVEGKSYSLASAEVGYQLSALAGGKEAGAVTLLLGMDNKVAQVRSFSGPYLADNAGSLPDGLEKVYRDGAASTNRSLERNDIYYVDWGLSTAYVYTKRVSGRIAALTPSAADPDTVTVGGSSYTIGEKSAADALSALGDQAEDSYVTLLLGMGGQVAKVITGDKVEDNYYGVLTSAVKDAGKEDQAKVRTTLTLLCTDGEQREFSMEGTTDLTTGDLARVSVSGRGVSISRLSSASLTGRVNAAARQIGVTDLASNVQILDVTPYGVGVTVKLERLEGLSLSEGDVKFVSRNKTGAIDHLILNDLTGDTWEYGFMKSAQAHSGGNSTTFSWIMDGVSGNRSLNASYPVSSGGFGVQYNADGSIRTLRQLSEVYLTSLGTRTAGSWEKEYPLADGVQVYFYHDKDYMPTTLDAVNTSSYVLTGWYDAFSGKAGSQIRIIIATQRET